MKDDWEKYRNTHPVRKDIDYTRRCDILRHSPAEKAIYEAMGKLEEMPADPLLTDAVVFLQRAKDRVADYIDGSPSSPDKEGDK